MQTAKHLILSALLLTMSSCSLLKFTINTGEKALTKEQADTRVMVRGYYSEFTSEVVQNADSIISVNGNNDIAIKAIKWKINASSACASAVYQTVPEVALVNAWALTLQMQQALSATPDAELFGSLSNMTRNTADSLLLKIDNIAKLVSSPARYDLIKEFVQQYVLKHKATDMNFIKNSLTLEFITFLSGNQSELAMNTGVMAEVLADMNDRVSGYGVQTVNELTWAGEMMKISIKRDSSAMQIASRADSLILSLRQMADMLNSSPELLDSLTKTVGAEMASIIITLNGGIDKALGTVSSERIALQEYITAERAALMADVEKNSKNIVEKAMDELPAMIRKVLTYVVLAVLLLFGAPFILGYYIGQRRSNQNKNNQKNQTE